MRAQGDTRRRLFRWLPALPLLGPAAHKALTSAATSTTVHRSAEVPVLPNVLRPIDLWIGPSASPHLIVVWRETGKVLPIVQRAGQYVVELIPGARIMAPTLEVLLRYAKQSYGMMP